MPGICFLDNDGAITVFTKDTRIVEHRPQFHPNNMGCFKKALPCDLEFSLPVRMIDLVNLIIDNAVELCWRHGIA